MKSNLLIEKFKIFDIKNTFLLFLQLVKPFTVYNFT